MSREVSHRGLRAVALAAGIAVTLLGCGEATETPPAGPPPDAAASGPSDPAEGPVGALAPGNLARMRAKGPPPFDLTGTWFIDTEGGQKPENWRFGPPYPKLTPAAQKHFDLSAKYDAEGKIYRDDIAECYPAGLPLIMTRFWPTAMVQVPTAIYMVSGFMNSFRTIFIDGRSHSEPDVAIRTANGESIGHWEGDTLVVDSRYFVRDYHWMDQGGRSIPAGEQLHIIERIRLLKDVDKLEIAYTMTDPEHWEGEWKSTKHFVRVNDVDIGEVVCTPELNKHLTSTQSSTYVR